MFTSIGTSLRALGAPLLDDLAIGLKQLTPTWLRVLKLQLVGGETIYPIVKGGGKQIGIVGKVSQGIQSIVASIKGLNPFAKLGEALKTLTPTWLKVLKLQMLGGETIYPIVKGGGKQVGVVGKVSQGIQKVVASIKGLNPFTGLGASLKTLGSSWKLAMSGALIGSAAGPAGAATPGVLTKVTNAIARIANVVKGIFSPASILGRFTGRIRGIFAIIGKALGFVSKMSGLTSFLKLGLSLGKAIPIVGQVIMVLTGIFGFITGAIKGFKTGGILGAIKGGLIGLYDGLIGSFLNLIYDIIGWVFKKLGFEKLGAFFSNLNFNFDGILNGIMWVIDKVQHVFHLIVNGLKKFANGFINKANYILPSGLEMTPFPIEPFVSSYEPSTTGASGSGDGEGVNVSDLPSASLNLSKIDTTNVANVADLAKVDYTNTMDAGDINAVFADQGDAMITVSDAEAKAKLGDLYDETRFKDDGQGSAIAAEALKQANLQLEKDMQLYNEAGGTPMIINDNSSKSQMNNTQMVSTGLSVDATDLVAAKLNMMLPAFN